MTHPVFTSILYSTLEYVNKAWCNHQSQITSAWWFFSSETHSFCYFPVEITLHDGAPVMSAVSCNHGNSSARFIYSKCVLIVDHVSGGREGGHAVRAKSQRSCCLFLPLILSLYLFTSLSLIHCLCSFVIFVVFTSERKYATVFEYLKCVCVSLRGILPVAVMEVWQFLWSGIAIFGHRKWCIGEATGRERGPGFTISAYIKPTAAAVCVK